MHLTETDVETPTDVGQMVPGLLGKAGWEPMNIERVNWVEVDYYANLKRMVQPGRMIHEPRLPLPSGMMKRMRYEET